MKAFHSFLKDIILLILLDNASVVAAINRQKEDTVLESSQTSLKESENIHPPTENNDLPIRESYLNIISFKGTIKC